MDVNNRMSSVAEHTRSSSATYTLQRHRDILNDYAKEFRKTKTNVEVNQDRDKLFHSSSTKGGHCDPNEQQSIECSAKPRV